MFFRQWITVYLKSEGIKQSSQNFVESNELFPKGAWSTLSGSEQNQGFVFTSFYFLDNFFFTVASTNITDI